jgi:recombination protein RecT
MNTAEKTVHPIVTLQNSLERRRDELHRALPSNITPDYFIRVFMTAAQINPDLVACERQSLWNAILRCAQDGLLPDGQEAVILPYKDKAQYQPMVQGLMKRFRNSGQFKSVAANVVRANEQFEHWIDENGTHMRHVPGDGSGEMVKAYAVATMLAGGTMVEVLSKAEIEKRRKSSKAPDGPMWRDWTVEAWKKTALRNLAKYLPKSSDLDETLRRDDEENYEFSERQTRPADVRSALTAFSESERESNPVKSSESKITSNPVSSSEPNSSSKPQDESAPTKSSRPEDESDMMSPAESKAFDAGLAAKHRGISRKAVPPEYRTPEASALAKAWWQGWDSV